MPRLRVLLPIAILCAGLLLAPWSPLRSTPRPAAEEILANFQLPVLPPPSSSPMSSSPMSPSPPNSQATEPAWHEPESSHEFLESALESDAHSDVFLDGIPDHAHQLTYLLRWLHGTSVRAFEAAPRFGGDRMHDATIFDDPTPPKHQPLLRLASRYWGYVELEDSYLIQGQPVPSEAWLWLHLMQGVTARGFIYRTNDLRGDIVERSKRLPHGFGPMNTDWRTDAKSQKNPVPDGPLLVGTPTPQGSLRFHHHPVQLNPGGPLDSEDRVWKIQSLQLVGLLNHPKPIVYEHPEKGMNSMIRSTTRPLNELESASLERLRAGTQRVAGWDDKHQRLQFLASIRAKDRCLKCHDVEPGTLLGAFTYWIEEKPDE